MAANPATTKDVTFWVWLVAYTVTDIDTKAGWITIKNADGKVVRQLNLNAVLFVETSQ